MRNALRSCDTQDLFQVALHACVARVGRGGATGRTVVVVH